MPVKSNLRVAIKRNGSFNKYRWERENKSLILNKCGFGCCSKLTATQRDGTESTKNSFLKKNALSFVFSAVAHCSAAQQHNNLPSFLLTNHQRKYHFLYARTEQWCMFLKNFQFKFNWKDWNFKENVKELYCTGNRNRNLIKETSSSSYLLLTWMVLDLQRKRK